MFTSFRISFRILRREPELTQFETAQIANLCPADAEEAKSIIPRCALRRIISHLTTDYHPFFLPPLVSLKSKMIDFRLYWTRFRLCGSSRHENVMEASRFVAEVSPSRYGVIMILEYGVLRSYHCP